jgi:hypothetical protein
MGVGAIVTCPRSQARANNMLFPVKSDACAAILPLCFPDVPNKGGRLNTMFDSYKASDSNAGWCWSVEHMVRTSVRWNPAIKLMHTHHKIVHWHQCVLFIQHSPGQRSSKGLQSHLAQKSVTIKECHLCWQWLPALKLETREQP